MSLSLFTHHGKGRKKIYSVTFSEEVRASSLQDAYEELFSILKREQVRFHSSGDIQDLKVIKIKEKTNG